MFPVVADGKPRYLDALQETHRGAIVAGYGQPMYDEVERGLMLWRDASAAGQVGRGRIIARKPGAIRGSC